ncbi:hypothetical protein [Pelolinea submarina]|uniref:Uncharacterized protein n=1 Tax=Pelolinea submarina TaxID=913107 RepID=A0A347ZVQ5_9CHLR|nr:hypothetical protein [Pelolinea submarina]REG07082.1 hypothetical protein DFR64_2286 [Pelolinea submarina]BBB49386.1 hypothetical protein Pelsub_P2617 [Pelolinea submarina]
MNISPTEAEEALAAIQKMTRRTRHTISSSGAYIFLIYTGMIWLAGFLANQFLPGSQAVYVWAVVSLLGSVLSISAGLRVSKHVKGPLTGMYGRRIGLFWVLLALFCIGVIAVAQPIDGKQITLIVILFVLVGQTAMSLVFSFSYGWWTLPIGALALVGYFLMPAYFYLWMAVLVGGSMILLGLIIRWKL